MKTAKMEQFPGKTLPILTRRVNLKKWYSVDKKNPRKGQEVWICDADGYGWADYELPATFDGKDYVGLDGMQYQGMSYWQPRKYVPITCTKPLK